MKYFLLSLRLALQLIHKKHLAVSDERMCTNIGYPLRVAQLDVRTSGDQEVAGSTLARLAMWRFDHEIFSTAIFSLPLIQEWQLSVSGERMCTILVTCLEN